MESDRLYMLVRNRVRDYATWRVVFDANLADAAAAGLELEGLWQAADDPNDVFFLLRVADRQRAQAFLEAPESAESGNRSGVLDGEYHYLTG
jgi:hypothetical protein